MATNLTWKKSNTGTEHTAEYGGTAFSIEKTPGGKFNLYLTAPKGRKVRFGTAAGTLAWCKEQAEAVVENELKSTEVGLEDYPNTDPVAEERAERHAESDSAAGLAEYDANATVADITDALAEAGKDAGVEEPTGVIVAPLTPEPVVLTKEEQKRIATDCMTVTNHPVVYPNTKVEPDGRILDGFSDAVKFPPMTVPVYDHRDSSPNKETPIGTAELKSDGTATMTFRSSAANPNATPAPRLPLNIQNARPVRLPPLFDAHGGMRHNDGRRVGSWLNG